MSSNARNPNRGRSGGEGKKAAAVAATALLASAVADEIGDNTCVVCFKVVEIFSIGECDHPVCYECSTRMRVLCKQNECPICRTDMSKVSVGGWGFILYYARLATQVLCKQFYRLILFCNLNLKQVCFSFCM